MTIQDIDAKISYYTKTNTTSFVAADRLIAVNNALNRVVSLINKSDQRWQWDDTNQSDLPIATTTITSGQQDYSLATSHLTIDRVEVKNGSNWTQLDPIDQHDIKGEALNSYLGSGIPTSYDIVGSSVFLYPIPNYTLAAALKIYFTRGPAEFTSAEVTTGTKVPGFNSLFHELIPLWVAYDYAVANGLSTANGFFAGIQRMEAELVNFYASRSRGERVGFTIATNGSSGTQSGVIGGRGGDSNK